jgi:hypothetical protein
MRFVLNNNLNSKSSIGLSEWYNKVSLLNLRRDIIVDQRLRS